jgi:hypothetical protein
VKHEELEMYRRRLAALAAPTGRIPYERLGESLEPGLGWTGEPGTLMRLLLIAGMVTVDGDRALVVRS